jgi:endo-1,3-1,4-beta-glycanase ExoK
MLRRFVVPVVLISIFAGCKSPSSEVSQSEIKALDDHKKKAGLDAKVEAYPGYTGVYENYELAIDDHFDSLNEKTWSLGDASFGENNCRFSKEGVKVTNGILQLVIEKRDAEASWSHDQGRWIEAKSFTCGELRSKDEFLYGRFETRMKNPKSNLPIGFISSMFTYRNNSDEGFKWGEIDIEMEGIRPSKFQSNLIIGEGTYNWTDTRKWGAFENKIEIGDTSEWRVFAIEWSPTAIKWFVDGELKHSLTNKQVLAGQVGIEPKIGIPDLAGKLMLNFWIPNDQVAPTFGGVTTNNVYPMVASYDWFRYFRYTGRK